MQLVGCNKDQNNAYRHIIAFKLPDSN